MSEIVPNKRKCYNELFEDSRKLNIDYIVDNDIKYGPCLIDTLSFTFKKYSDKSIIDVLKPFGFDFQLQTDADGLPISKGGWHHIYVDDKTKSRLQCGWICCGYPELSSLNITGAACGYLNSTNQMQGFCNTIYGLRSFADREKEVKCTRIDIAKDCFTSLFFDFVCTPELKRDRMYYSHGMAIQVYNPKVNGVVQNGWTVYFGQRRKSFYVRIYDKKREQRIKDERLPYWSRFEIEIKNAKTKDAIKAFDAFCKGHHLNDIMIELCRNRFFLLKQPFKSDKPYLDDVVILPEFRRFLEYDLNDKESKLVFCEVLYNISKTKKDAFRKKMLYAYAPPVLDGLTGRQIISRLAGGVYYETPYKIDRDNGGIWVYYQSRSGNCLDDIPFYHIDVPPEFFELYAEASGEGELTLEQLQTLIDEANRLHFNCDVHL